ncbi:hypothetical protein CBR_g31240 [Chara braunii]|uniref:DDE Tnp4 domain-containing protein n=1 Tax=Chara braunii TaxID=69332 RepID=A0A388JXQ6_CHABU|nr:hypothetical protein CBR_g31240 [Chara braunii]|eukprot:GBG62604.1 hypothetical protein CBR_g31240 [Chara braunii]
MFGKAGTGVCFAIISLLARFFCISGMARDRVLAGRLLVVLVAGLFFASVVNSRPLDTKPLDYCDFYFDGYEFTVPEFTLTGGGGDVIFSTQLRIRSEGVAGKRFEEMDGGGCGHGLRAEEMEAVAMAVSTVVLKTMNEMSSSSRDPYGGIDQGPDEERFDNRQKVARGCVERAFGRLKCMWRLFLRTHKTNLETLPQQFVAVCTLHNILLDAGIDFDENLLWEVGPDGVRRRVDLGIVGGGGGGRPQSSNVEGELLRNALRDRLALMTRKATFSTFAAREIACCSCDGSEILATLVLDFGRMTPRETTVAGRPLAMATKYSCVSHQRGCGILCKIALATAFQRLVIIAFRHNDDSLVLHRGHAPVAPRVQGRASSSTRCDQKLAGERFVAPLMPSPPPTVPPSRSRRQTPFPLRLPNLRNHEQARFLTLHRSAPSSISGYGADLSPAQARRRLRHRASCHGHSLASTCWPRICGDNLLPLLSTLGSASPTTVPISQRCAAARRRRGRILNGRAEDDDADVQGRRAMTPLTQKNRPSATLYGEKIYGGKGGNGDEKLHGEKGDVAGRDCSAARSFTTRSFTARRATSGEKVITANSDYCFFLTSFSLSSECGNQFYANQDKIASRSFNNPMDKFLGKYIMVHLTSAQLEPTSQNLNYCDGNSYYPEERRSCALHMATAASWCRARFAERMVVITGLSSSGDRDVSRSLLAYHIHVPECT